MKRINNCSSCNASGYLLTPAWYNNLKAFQVVCVAKGCLNESKQYDRRGNAIRFWNKVNNND